MTTPSLRLTGDDIAAVAAGRPTWHTLSTLQAGQRSKRRLLLRELRRQLVESARLEVDEAIRLLERAARQHPGPVDRVLAAPLMNAWMIGSLRAINHPDRGHDGVAEGVGTLRAVAAAAAARAGIDFELVLASRDDAVWLPTLGTAHGVESAQAVVRATAEGFTVTGTDRAAETASRPRWQPVRSMAPDPTAAWSIDVEDQDPFRSCFDHVPAATLSDADYSDLTARFRQAWRVLVTDHQHDARTARLALRAVVPLAAPTTGEQTLSASSRVAYGCVAATTPPDAATLVMLLIHELRHMLLGGLLDFVDLHVEEGPVRLHAPWRLDPRPAGALLQGTYAHVGVTEFWRAQRRREVSGTPARLRAEFEFAYWRCVTGRAVATLRDSGELTYLGLRFVAGISATLDQCRNDAVPASVATAAEDAANADTVLWRIVNQTAGSHVVGQLEGLLRAGAACSELETAVVRSGAVRPARHRGLSASIRNGLLRGNPGSLADADRAFLKGDLRSAAEGYRTRIDADVDDIEAWVGLAMTLRRLDSEPAATVLELRPDIVRAIYRGDRADGTAAGRLRTPDDVATWLATGVLAGPSTDGC